MANGNECQMYSTHFSEFLEILTIFNINKTMFCDTKKKLEAGDSLETKADNGGHNKIVMDNFLTNGK